MGIRPSPKPDRPLHSRPVIIKLIAAFIAGLLVPSSPSAHAQSALAFDGRTTRSASSALQKASAVQKAARVWGTAKVIQGGATTASMTTASATTASATHAGTATGLSCATFTSEAAIAGFALTQAAVLVAVGVTLHLHLSRAGSIATYGNPYGIPAQDIAFPLQRGIRARRARPSIPDPYPIPEPAPVPAPGDEKPDESRPGRLYATYTLHGARRARVRGIKNFRGGAWSDTGSKAERLTENAIRGVARDNPLGQIFHATANLTFGEIAPYTGIVRF